MPTNLLSVSAEAEGTRSYLSSNDQNWHAEANFGHDHREEDRLRRIKEEGWDRFAPVTETNRRCNSLPTGLLRLELHGARICITMLVALQAVLGMFH